MGWMTEDHFPTEEYFFLHNFLTMSESHPASYKGYFHRDKGAGVQE
jgi:hypothetical protein